MFGPLETNTVNLQSFTTENWNLLLNFQEEKEKFGLNWQRRKFPHNTWRQKAERYSSKKLPKEGLNGP